MGCLPCEKYSKQCKTMPSGPPEFIPQFIPVTGMKCPYGKISSTLTKTRDLGNRASPPSHMNTSKIFQRISREGEISETGPARSTGIIWSTACEQALHLGERSEQREGDTQEKRRECPWSWRKTDVKIQFPFQVIAFAFNLSVHHPALSKVKACRLSLSCFQLLENLIGNYHQSVNSIYPPRC